MKTRPELDNFVLLDPPSDPLRCSRGVGLALAICVPGWMLLGVILWAVCK
jgi:hypothetical protein